MFETLKNILPVLPETVLFFFAVLSLPAGVYAAPAKAKQKADRLIYTGMIAAFALLCLTDVPAGGLSAGFTGFVLDRFALWLKKIMLIGSMAALAFGADWLKYKKYSRFEFAPLLAFCVVGMMLTVSAQTFLVQFLGLEMMHFPLLFLTAYKRQGERSTEAGTKYVVMVFLSSGLYLFGVSVLYACLGTLDFALLAAADKQAIMPALLWGVSFIAAGLFLKIGAAPFHSWAADVYEGAPSPVTALFAMVVRLPVIAALARIVLEPFASLTFYWQPVLAVTAVLSVCIGGFGAIVQTNIKRLTAYTVIVLNGFALSALVVRSAVFLQFALTIDLVMLAGMSAIVLSLRIGDELSEEIRVLSGQGQTKPVRGGLFTLIFLGLAGAPPFAGFWTRFWLFKETAVGGMMIFCVLLMLGGLLIMYVYLKLIRQMYMVTAKEELSFAPVPMKIVIVLSAVLSAFSFVAAQPLLDAVQTAVMNF